jgi:putative sterol carrier protein
MSAAATLTSTLGDSRTRADCTIRATKQVFDGVAGGEVNATAAVLRGALVVEGDPELLTLFQRLFPGPPKRDGT